MTSRNDLILKSEISGKKHNHERIEHNINKKNIKKMHIDREGVHCIIVSDYELFYNNWNCD